MELRHLAAFVAVAEEGSFTRASDRLHVVQSAVSAAVRALERELGAPVFDRTTHRVAITDAGRALLPEARAALAAAAAAREAVDQVRGGLRGTVRLGVMQADALRPFSVARLLAAFRAAAPDVEVLARQDIAAEIAARIVDGRLDLAFVALASAAAPGLALTELSAQPLHLAVHPTHRLAGRTAVDLAETVGETFADGPPGFGSRVAVDRAYAAAGLQRTVAFQVNDMTTLVDFVRCGVAAAFLAPSFIRDDRDISLVAISRHAPSFVTYLAAPDDRRLGAAATALLTLARGSIRELRSR